MVKKSKFNYWLIPIVLIVILIVAFAIDFLYRTLFYQNHLKTCVDKDSFCGIQVINISLPENYRSKLLEISETKGVRIEIPKKHQKNISYTELKKEVPDIDDCYESLSSVLSP
jgi:capsular polysaccharide biosynthesis protein